MDREAMERLVVRLMGLAQRCKDSAISDELMRAADELVDIIEGWGPHKDADKRQH